MLTRSRFAHFYERGQEAALFHSLTGEIVFGDRALLELFLSFPEFTGEPHGRPPAAAAAEEPNVSALEVKGILVKDRSSDVAMVDDLMERFQRDVERPIWQLYILPTTQCNLACTYCFVDTHSRHPAMTTSIARKAVRYFLRHSQGEPKPRIFFYGGEPLMNKAAVYAAADEARRIESEGDGSRKIDLSLITNGYALDRETAKELKSWNMRVSVSIDGPAIVHDFHRTTKDGRGTYARAFRALEILQDVGIEPGVSATITPLALEHWGEVIEFLTDTVKVKSVDFNVLLPGKGYPNDYSETPIAVSDALLRAHARFSVEGIYEDRVMRYVKAFKAHKFRFTDCPGVGQQIAVGPDGSVGPCQGLIGERRYFPLNVDVDFDQHPSEHSLFTEWNRRTPLIFPECLDCPAISICGGGCPLAVLRDQGGIWEVDERICEQVKPIHEWLVWQLLDDKLTSRN